MPKKMRRVKRVGKGFIGDAWKWVKNAFSKGHIGKIANLAGDLTGNQGIKDIGMDIQKAKELEN